MKFSAEPIEPHGRKPLTDERSDMEAFGGRFVGLGNRKRRQIELRKGGIAVARDACRVSERIRVATAALVVAKKKRLVGVPNAVSRS